jgi:L-iditol 2-dehydrogenase
VVEDAQAILEATDGRGVDVAFDVAGDQPAVETAVAALRPAGHVVLAGIPSDDRTAFTASVARRKGLTIAIARRSTPQAFERAVAVVGAATLDLARLVTMRVPLDDATRAFASLGRRDGIKVLIEPNAG